MPEISRFGGIVITMYFNEHNPPHFHATYNGIEALFDLNVNMWELETIKQENKRFIDKSCGKKEKGVKKYWKRVDKWC